MADPHLKVRYFSIQCPLKKAISQPCSPFPSPSLLQGLLSLANSLRSREGPSFQCATRACCKRFPLNLGKSWKMSSNSFEPGTWRNMKRMGPIKSGAWSNWWVADIDGYHWISILQICTNMCMYIYIYYTNKYGVWTSPIVIYVSFTLTWL